MMRDTIVTGNARDLTDTIPDGCARMVFTDPVYQNLDDYDWLARLALRVLQPRGVVLVWTSFPNLGATQSIMEAAGLQYVYTLCYTVIAKTWRMHWYHLFSWTTPCLWFQRPGEATRPNQWMPDTIQETILLDNTVIANEPPETPFVWNKNPKPIRVWIERFTRSGEIVVDPFAGTGTVPVVCQTLGRSFYACERDPERAEEARRRLAATPLPLWIDEPDSLPQLRMLE